MGSSVCVLISCMQEMLFTRMIMSGGVLPVVQKRSVTWPVDTVLSLLKLDFKMFTSRRPYFRRIYHQLDGELVVHDVGALGQQLERRQGHMGGIKFSSFKVSSGGISFLTNRGAVRNHYSFAEYPLLLTPGGCHN